MALVTGTYTRYTAQGLREHLTDVIYDISPEDTPFVNGAGRGKANQTLFEWQTDVLGNVDTANAHLDGDDITSFPTVVPTVRVGNYTQISRKLLIISGTLEAVDKAGRKSELSYQLSRRGAEMKRDMEAISLANQGGDAGGVGTARRTATLGAWVKTNVSFNSTGGGNPVYASGVPGVARTDGTLRAFTETILKTVIQSAWTSGAKPSTLMVGPVNKQRASGFPGIVTRNFDMSNTTAKPTATIAAVDVYVSDFGTFKVIPNRFQRERDAWLVDFDYVSIMYLRPFQQEALAKTGDAHKRMMLAEWGLKVNQEAALGLCADLTTT
jgi:hypothetical protein